MRFLLSLLASFALIALPQAVPAAAPSGTPVVIGAILSITGLYAPLGEPESRALRLAEKDINAHGGVAGRPLRILIQDDEGKADVAAQLATSLIGQNVALIIGGSLTPTSLAISRVTSAAKIVQLYPTPTSAIWNTKAGVAKYVFEVTPRNEIEAAKLLSFTKSKLGTKKIAVLHDDAPYGSQGAAIVTDEAHRQGLEVADDEPFPITSTDVTAQLGRIKGSGADSIVIWTAAPAAALAVRQIRALGLNVHVVGSTGIASDN
ncbi:MAG TPA: ABC transporter substrate-binding protein, partial [Candidatus Baltobacteraceae bacterium]|nr:ABC transporter substrate-binding protein [Candidatus Baltobacteraceae bacterium]